MKLFDSKEGAEPTPKAKILEKRDNPKRGSYFS